MTTSPPKFIRSPSYPNMPLRDAVAAVAKIEKPYRSSPVDRTNAVKLIGYSALSGPANKALAALAAYGLLERAGKGETRVTERARDILHAESEAQRKARLFEAAMQPDLYREIRERFSGIVVPPEDGVVTYLNRQGFNPNAVRPAAKAFLETMSYLEELGAIDSHGSGSEDAGNSGEQQQPENVVTPQEQQTKTNPSRGNAPVRVVVNGDRLDIQASVDLAGLKSLQDLLKQYEGILEMTTRMNQTKETAN